MLNAEQKKAVQTTEGRVLILAGAGSGKTTVLAHRIAYMIRELNIPSTAILGLTFTNKAAEEMRERVGSILDSAIARKITLCTFHSFCMKLLRKEIHHLGYTSDFSLYDEQDVKRLLNQLARYLLEHEGELPSLEKTMTKIAATKNQAAGKSVEAELTQELAVRLKSCMRAYNAVDFDALLSLTVELFEEHPQILQKYQDRFRYIMIDEYQDTNPVQFRLAALLSKKSGNLCVVGDDDQSIYGWRGADVQHILQFEAKTIIKLEQNYRSTPTILKGANAVIGHNQERHEKVLWSRKEMGESIELFHAPSEVEEAQAVIHRLTHLRKQRKLQWKEMVILYRSNILSRPFEEALLQAIWEKEGRWVKGIPYTIFGGTELYERSEVKDLMAYLRFIANPRDQEALLRIINVPRRGISDRTLDFLTQRNRREQILLWELLKTVGENDAITERAVKSIHSFIALIEEAQRKFQKGALAETLSWLLEAVDYKKAIVEEVKSEKMRAFKWENVQYCVNTLKQYEEDAKNGSSDALDPKDLLSNFLSTTLLDRTHWKEKELFKEDRLNLMTFHSAKGLEFTVCFLVALEDHLLPHEKSLELKCGLEEERRLMYVAMTRAKEKLVLSMALQRKRLGKDHKSSPSRFLFEIPKELIQISSWKKF
jgi:DNA helicase II / ATP-dependent DNA helicase PcrA